MSNLFETWAEQEKPKWQERKERIARLRKAKLAQVMQEKRDLEQRYQAVKDEDRAKLLAGPHGEALGELLSYLDTLSLRAGGGAELLGFVRQWCKLHAPSPDLRFEALHLIASAIANLRESQGLPPFDDPIFEQRRSVFLRMREMLS